MPGGHGRTVFIPDNVAHRRSSALSRRSLEQCSRKLPSKENIVIVPVLRNCEERRIVLRFLPLDAHLSSMLGPSTSFIQGPELRNEHGSQNPVANMLDSYNPQPNIFIHFDLLKERSLSSQENSAFISASAQTVTGNRSSSSNVGESHRLTRNNISKNLNNSLSTAESKESSWFNHGSDCIASNASTDATCKVDKPVKQGSRKKGKKKRKQYKRSMHKKASIKPDNQDEEANCDASKSETCELSLSTSLEDNPEVDMNEDSIDDCGTECAIANEGEFNPLENSMNLNSRNVSVQVECKEYSHQDNGLSSSRLVNCSDWKNDVADTDWSSERLLGSSQASSSDDFHPVIRTKRGRPARKFSGCSNEVHKLNNTHLHRFSEINNKNSIWQKVEKASTLELTRPRNNENLASRNVDISLNCELKQSRWGKSFRCSDGMDSSQSYSSIVSSIVKTDLGDISMDGSTYLEKLRRKPNLVSEQESQCVRHTSINNINIPSKTQALSNENFGTAVELTNISQLTDKINTSTKNSLNKILQKATGPDSICSILQNKSAMSQEFPAYSSAIESNSDQSHTDTNFHSTTQPYVDIINDPCICTNKDDIQCKRVDVKSALLVSSRINNISGPPSVPSTRQDLMIIRSQMDDRAYSSVHNPIPSSLNSSFADEFISHVSTKEIQCSSSSSSSMDCSSPEEGELIINKLGSQPCTSSEESSDFPSPSDCNFSLEMKGQSFPVYVNDLSKIIEAVDGSYKLMVAAEGFKLATGSPLAGFERVLHSASPLIETGCISMCSTCSRSQIIGESLCFHQVPNMTLRSLWQWYEKPGSYGLEVKLDDLYSSKRTRTSLSKVCAYFVPYLSAVQLFGRSGKSIYHSKNDSQGDLMKICDTSKCSTSLASLPIFSKLLPQPWKKEDTRSTKVSSSGKSEEFNKPIYREQLADELLFEYFDSDQPQQRRPLFEKIQELILGDSSSNCHFFGDPSKLGCLNLKELHPASWYAVAWYPIYRIPDGSFRAAFLTYHSFGRFVRRSTSDCFGSCINSLILPVSGLQSYNTQGEFWFEPTDPAMLNFPSETLKDRLESLERTAHVMSRVTIRKGNQNCTNRHPDYEFFLSRKSPHTFLPLSTRDQSIRRRKTTADEDDAGSCTEDLNRVFRSRIRVLWRKPTNEDDLLQKKGVLDMKGTGQPLCSSSFLPFFYS